jgi:hypothetical protein
MMYDHKHEHVVTFPYLVSEAQEVVHGQGPSQALPQQHLMRAHISRQPPVAVHVCSAATTATKAGAADESRAKMVSG